MTNGGAGGELRVDLDAAFIDDLVEKPDVASWSIEHIP